MNREQLNKACSARLQALFEPLRSHIFNEVTVQRLTDGWSREMTDLAMKAHRQFRDYLAETMREQGMTGIQAKTFARLWMNEFHDHLWSARKRVSHHAFLSEKGAHLIVNLCRRIVGEFGHDHHLSERALMARLYLIDWFHYTRTGRSLTSMQWFVGADESNDLILMSPDWEVLKGHLTSQILTTSSDGSGITKICVSGSLAESKRDLEHLLDQDGKDAVDIILIKTKGAHPPWKPTFPVKAYQNGFKSDFNKLDLKLLASWFPKSKTYQSGSLIPDKVKAISAA